VGSRDLSQAEKETNASNNYFDPECISFTAQGKSRGPTANSQKLEDM
jgi:hypothetical protein